MCDGAGLAATLIEALRVGFAMLEAIAHERARTGWARGALARQQQHAANHARARGLLDGAIHCLFALVDAHAAAKRRVLLHLSELVDAQARTDGVSRAQLVRLCKLVFAGERELCRGADRALPRMLCAFCSDGVRALFTPDLSALATFLHVPLSTFTDAPAQRGTLAQLALTSATAGVDLGAAYALPRSC